MLTADAVVDAVSGLAGDDLHRWVAFGWVQPTGCDQLALFDGVDVARVRLIWELHYELHLDPESVPVVLSLLDQLYATRRKLRDVLAAVDQQNPTVRADIASRIASPVD